MKKFFLEDKPQITINFLQTHARETAFGICLRKLLISRFSIFPFKLSRIMSRGGFGMEMFREKEIYHIFERKYINV